MSVYFQRPTHASQGLNPLFRLLDDFEAIQGSRTHRSHVPSFRPRFDVRETEGNYELYGELPGMNKNDVHIEFSDPQTMVIRGRVQRSYTSGAPAAVEEKKPEAVAQSGEESPRSHQATVEDDEDAEGFTSVNTPATEESSAPKESPKQTPKDTAKYWVSERSIGEFSRSFNFPAHVDSEAVSASLRDGILNIVIPKLRRNGAQRIFIE